MEICRIGQDIRDAMVAASQRGQEWATPLFAQFAHNCHERTGIFQCFDVVPRQLCEAEGHLPYYASLAFARFLKDEHPRSVMISVLRGPQSFGDLIATVDCDALEGVVFVREQQYIDGQIVYELNPVSENDLAYLTLKFG